MNGDNPEEVAAQAALATAENEQREETGEVVLSNGVKLRLQTIPPLLLEHVRSQVPVPKVPIFRNPDKGRDEENPNDPDYLIAMEGYHSTLGMAVVNLLLLMGVKVDKTPRGFPKPDSDGWVEDLKLIGVKVPDSENGRKLMWLRGVALVSSADVSLLIPKLLRLHGMAEEDVALAAESFPSDVEGRSNTNGAAPQSGEDGD